MPRKIVGGYAHLREINRAKRANYAARQALGRILEEKPGQARTAELLSESLYRLSLELEALIEMETIIQMEKIIQGGGEAQFP